MQLANRKKLFILLGILFIIIVLPFAIYVSQKTQEIRQQAAGEDLSFFFTLGDTTPITQLNLTPGQQGSIKLYVNTLDKNINSFDITIQFPTDIIISSLQEGSGASSFNDLLLNEINSQANNLRFVKTNKSPQQNPVIRGAALHLATLNFTAGQNAAEGSITIPNAIVTSPSNLDATLSSAKPQIATTVAEGPTGTAGAIQLSLSVSLPPAREQNKLITVKLLDASNTETTKTQQLQGSGNGLYTGTVDMEGQFVMGPYRIKISTSKYMTKLVGKDSNEIVQTITPGQPYTVPPVTLVVGDANGDNTIDPLDYNMLISCFGDKANSPTCINKSAVDFDEDGIIGPLDIQLYFPGARTRQGD